MKTTNFIMTALVVCLGLYDILAIKLWGVDESVSRWFWDFRDYPVVMLVVGFLCGHWWGKMNPRTDGAPKPLYKNRIRLAIFYPGKPIWNERFAIRFLAYGRMKWLQMLGYEVEWSLEEIDNDDFRISG